jgi:hypothetical protein
MGLLRSRRRVFAFRPGRAGSDTGSTEQCAAHKLPTILLDTMLTHAGFVMQCSETQFAFGTFDCCEHFSLANPFLLAIMSGQLGNAWDGRFQLKNGNATFHTELGWNPREVSPRDVFIGEPAAWNGCEADVVASARSGSPPNPYPQ